MAAQYTYSFRENPRGEFKATNIWNCLIWTLGISDLSDSVNHLSFNWLFLILSIGLPGIVSLKLVVLYCLIGLKVKKIDTIISTFCSVVKICINMDNCRSWLNSGKNTVYTSWIFKLHKMCTFFYLQKTTCILYIKKCHTMKNSNLSNQAL